MDEQNPKTFNRCLTKKGPIGAARMTLDEAGSQSRSPHASVIIPVYNDPAGIRTTLESLVAQEYNDYEIVPVDNNSTDETGAVIAEFEHEYPSQVVPREETTVQSSYAARNTGIEGGSGDILLFLDADMWVADGWINGMVDVLETRECDYLACDVQVVTSDDPSFAEQYERALAFPVETYLAEKQFAPTCALAVKRDVFEMVGPFDQRLVSGGDKEFGHRVFHAGLEQCYTEEITAYHPSRDTWSDLKSKAIRIGRGRTQMRKYHPNVEGYPHPLHPINYLPPNPFRLRRRYSGEVVSLASLVGFYGLEYILKLTQAYGMIRESIAQRRGEQ